MAAAASLKRMSEMTPEELKKLFGMSELPTSYKDLDPQKLPFEDLEQFSYDGLAFEEAADQLWNHLSIMHYHAATYNRHSEWFPIACAQLEKDIRMMGSFCLTKAVLEKSGHSFPGLEHMDIKELYGATSFYFRKCGKAFEDLYATTGLISIQMHQWEMRWYTLGERLKATQAKIQKILDGKIKIDDLLEREEIYKKEKTQDAQQEKTQNTQQNEPQKEKKPLELWQHALPMIGTYARQITRERIEEDRIYCFNKKIELMKAQSELSYAKEDARRAREDAKEARQKEKAARASKSHRNQTAEPPASDENQSQNPLQQKIKETGMTLPELRAVLMKKAEIRGEGSQIMQIAGDPPELLLERWERYRREDTKHRPPACSPGHKKKKKRK